MILALLLGGTLSLTGPAPAAGPVGMRPDLVTAPVAVDADDPALWLSPDGRTARVFATDKDEARGAIYAFDDCGRVVQRVPGLRRPNNGDVEYGLKGIGDIYVATERKSDRLRIFAVSPKGVLRDVTGTTGTADEPMGVSLYKRPRDGRIFAVVSPKKGTRNAALHWYELTARDGIVDAIEVASGGRFSGKKEVESIVVDDEMGTVWYSDETVGSRCVPADPASPQFGRELAFINRTGFRGDHEGIARVGGYLLFTDQLPGRSEVHVRERRAPYREVGVFTLGADETDGLDAADAWGPRYPRGVVVAMNSRGKNFLGAGWPAIRTGLRTR